MRKSLLALSLLLLIPSSASASEVNSAVSNSAVAQMNSHPEVVRLEMHIPTLFGDLSRRIEPFCSGTLISSRYVLTAGHCVSEDIGSNQEDFEAMRPRVRLMNQEGKPAIKVARVAYYGPYATYEDFSGLDIALLELAWDAPVKPAELAALTEGAGQQMRVFGYGLWKKKGFSMSDELRYGSNITVADPQKCLNRAGLDVKVHDYQICTVTDVKRGFKSELCSGDSGGPLMDSKGRVVGVNSLAQQDNCQVKASKQSGVYARVSSGAEWLRQQTGLPLFGTPARSQDLTAPTGVRMAITSATSRKVTVTASADGSDWKAAAKLQAVGLAKKDRIYGMVRELTLTPENPSGVMYLPKKYRSSKVIYTSTIGRFWNSINNGTTSMPRQKTIRP